MTHYSVQQLYASEAGWYTFDAAWKNWKLMFQNILGNSLLDLGSGAGISLSLAKMFEPNLEVLGVEADKNASEVSNRRGIRTISDDIYSLSLADNSFDTVWSSHVLEEHLKDPFLVVKESVRVARKRIIHSVPIGNVDDKNMGSQHLHIYNRINFTNLFQTIDLKNIKLLVVEDSYMSSFIMVCDK